MVSNAANFMRASNFVWRTPPDWPPDAAVSSPASSTISAENVWSLKLPEVTALEVR